MKAKKIIGILITLFISITLIGCKEPIEKYEKNLSELRENVFEADNENFSVSIITGYREEPYVMDGHCGNVVDFTVITLTPLREMEEENIAYAVILNETEYSGAFLPHPFGKTYSAEINVKTSNETIQLRIIRGSIIEEIQVKSVLSPEMITASKAVEVAENRLKSQIESLKIDGELTAEIYVRLLANPIDNSGGYYWYVAFIGSSQVIYAVLINPLTLEIAAVRD